ncbi:hypothetical protein DF216_10865 [Streptococcus oralis]|uniref:L1 transposable element dsRBD-like domain-containing protein n=1 Tax=Streptococcus oralis TaxID=1303 RepID=A0A4Q2FAB7_STROR|nr:hypothetical protein DF216_10865 [Streptococcus oralis]
MQNTEDKNFQPRLFYPVKMSFGYDREMKTSPDKQKLRECIMARPPTPITRNEQEGPHTWGKKERVYKALSKKTKRQIKSENYSYQNRLANT